MNFYLCVESFKFKPYSIFYEIYLIFICKSLNACAVPRECDIPRDPPELRNKML